jgi:hypothetical protein
MNTESVPQSKRRQSLATVMRDAEPWPDPVNGAELLAELASLLDRHIILPDHAAETLALWCLHTYAFELREVGTYIGIESPEKRCGKTTLRGILNAGYHRDSAYVLRVAPGQEPGDEPGLRLGRFSCWCPKAISLIGRLPDTLADRCIVIRMHRKRPNEICERLRGLRTEDLRRKCARFALDNADRIAAITPEVPPLLHDRAGDVWEPLLALAEVAGGDWPAHARDAAVALTLNGQERHPIATLLFDIFTVSAGKEQNQVFSRDLVFALARRGDRPWKSICPRKELTEAWLADCLRPYGIKPKTIRMGDAVGRGYDCEEFLQAASRYIPKNEVTELIEEFKSLCQSKSPTLPRPLSHQ